MQLCSLLLLKRFHDAQTSSCSLYSAWKPPHLLLGDRQHSIHLFCKGACVQATVTAYKPCNCRIQALADNLAASVSLSYEPSPRLAVAASFSPQHVWGAMQTLGSLDQHLSGLIQHMLLILVQPLATCSHSARVTRFDEENTAIFQICSNDSNGDADVMNIVSASLTTCLQFLASTLPARPSPGLAFRTRLSQAQERHVSRQMAWYRADTYYRQCGISAACCT